MNESSVTVFISIIIIIATIFVFILLDKNILFKFDSIVSSNLCQALVPNPYSPKKPKPFPNQIQISPINPKRAWADTKIM